MRAFGVHLKERHWQVKFFYLALILIPIFCFSAALRCEGLDYGGVLDLPPAEPEEIKERNSLEDFQLEKKHYLKEDLSKEKRAFHPPLAPENNWDNYIYDFRLKKGSFDYSDFGIKSAGETEKLYYKVDLGKDKTKGETDFFESENKSVVLQAGSSAGRALDYYLYFGGYQKNSGVYSKNTTQPGGRLGFYASDKLKLSADIDFSRSILKENNDWLNNYYNLNVSASYNPAELYLIETAYNIEYERRSDLSASTSEYRRLNCLEIMNWASFRDYFSLGAGYKRKASENLAQARLTVPLASWLNAQLSYMPDINIYTFDDWVMEQFKASSFEAIEYSRENNPLAAAIELDLPMQGLELSLEAVHTTVKNYLIWESSGEYLTPNFLDSAHKKEYALSGGYSGDFLKSRISVLNRQIRDNFTGNTDKSAPGWVINFENDFDCVYFFLGIDYLRQSGVQMSRYGAKVDLSSYDIASIRLSKDISGRIKLSFEAYNIFSKEHQDRPVYSQTKPNYTLGINVLF